MSEATNNQPRKRVNAKQSAKGQWQLDVTIETFTGESPIDQVIETIEEAKKKFTERGLQLTES